MPITTYVKGAFIRIINLNFTIDYKDLEVIFMVQEKEEKKESSCFEDKIQEPLLFKVILHNDDYTTMEFVIAILREIFRKNLVEAEQIMMQVHKSGQSVVGIYTREIAEMKVARTLKRAKDAGFPLSCTFEPNI